MYKRQVLAYTDDVGVGADSDSSRPNGDARAIPPSLKGADDTLLTRSWARGRWLGSLILHSPSKSPSVMLPVSVRKPDEFDLLLRSHEKLTNPRMIERLCCTKYDATTSDGL